MSSCLGGVTHHRSAARSLVRLEGAVDGAILLRRVGEVGAALPPGLGQDSVQEAWGAVRRSHRGAPSLQVPFESQWPADAVSPQQLRSAATAAGTIKSVFMTSSVIQHLHAQSHLMLCAVTWCSHRGRLQPSQRPVQTLSSPAWAWL